MGLHLQPVGLWVGPLYAFEAQMPFSPPAGLGPDVHLHLGGRGSPAPSSSPRWPRCGSPSCRLATSPPRCWLHPSLWDGRRKGQQQRSVGRAVLSDSYHHSFIHSFSKIRDESCSQCSGNGEHGGGVPAPLRRALRNDG